MEPVARVVARVPAYGDSKKDGMGRNISEEK